MGSWGASWTPDSGAEAHPSGEQGAGRAERSGRAPGRCDGDTRGRGGLALYACGHRARSSPQPPPRLRPHDRLVVKCPFRAPQRGREQELSAPGDAEDRPRQLSLRDPPESLPERGFNKAARPAGAACDALAFHGGFDRRPPFPSLATDSPFRGTSARRSRRQARARQRVQAQPFWRPVALWSQVGDPGSEGQVSGASGPGRGAGPGAAGWFCGSFRAAGLVARSGRLPQPAACTGVSPVRNSGLCPEPPTSPSFRVLGSQPRGPQLSQGLTFWH